MALASRHLFIERLPPHDSSLLALRFHLTKVGARLLNAATFFNFGVQRVFAIVGVLQRAIRQRAY